MSQTLVTVIVGLAVIVLTPVLAVVLLVEILRVIERKDRQ